jgi:cation diffusion facilitator family transporter
MADCGCGAEHADKLERRTLVVLLAINGTMFVAESVVGVLAESAGLIADSLDMLADAFVYGLSLYAVGKGAQRQARAATLSGYFQIVLGLGVMLEVIRRLIYGSEPQSVLIITVGAIALIANVACLVLISKHRDGGVHMRASWIFSTNDVIANLGVMISGGLVWLVNSRLPDLFIGLVIAFVVVKGGFKILRETNAAKANPAQT